MHTRFSSGRFCSYRLIRRGALVFLAIVLDRLAIYAQPATDPATAPDTPSIVIPKVELTKVPEIYAAICASCHGAKFEGGLGGSLVDGQWHHGASDEAIAAVITGGLADKGMPAFGEAMTDAQIRALVVFIREQERLAVSSATQLDRPVPNEAIPSQQQSFRLQVITEGLDVPWALGFLPDGRFLVTERIGRLRLIAPDGTLDPVPVADTPPVIFDGPEGGLMDVALHPDFAETGWIYLAFAEGKREDGKQALSMTAVVRGRLDGHRWIDQQWIYRADAKHYTKSGAHYGSRLAFDSGYLFINVGERGAMGQAQDTARPNGKILRLHDDGRVPADNPFVGQANSDPALWSIGHRNAQGLVVDPRTHALYATEHGARGGDEFNLITRGGNYGWPTITHGINYDGRPIAASTARDGMLQPLVHWTPSIAPSGLACYTGERFPAWSGDFFVGSLKAQELRRLRVEAGQVVQQELLFQGFGRVRDVRSGPDGLIYILTNSPGRLLRMLPAE